MKRSAGARGSSPLLAGLRAPENATSAQEIIARGEIVRKEIGGSGNGRSNTLSPGNGVGWRQRIEKH